MDGGGIVLGRLGLAFREIMAGRLVAPFKHFMHTGGAFYFICEHQELENKSTLNFLAWLRDEVEEQRQKQDEFLASKTLIEV